MRVCAVGCVMQSICRFRSLRAVAAFKPAANSVAPASERLEMPRARVRARASPLGRPGLEAGVGLQRIAPVPNAVVRDDVYPESEGLKPTVGLGSLAEQ
jgi:hypothetical protein